MPLRSKIFLLLAALIALAGVPGPLNADEPSLYEYILTDLDAKETTLEAYKGRVLVLEFFATWCPPCRKDLPQIASLQENYPPEKVVFLAISADGTSDTLRSLPGFLKETGLKIPVLVGGDIFVDKYAGVDKRGMREIILPQTYVFDGDGEMSLRLVGEHKSKAKTLGETLERLMKASAS
jgi:cytochrome c biogenesis protein CcmG, thiol:disulfide interchange protein DsbE